MKSGKYKILVKYLCLTRNLGGNHLKVILVLIFSEVMLKMSCLNLLKQILNILIYQRGVEHYKIVGWW